MEVDHEGMEVLDEPSCVDLLRTSAIGRVALTSGALPVILPVTFAFLDTDVIFAVASGVIARAADSAQVVCFEADWADESFRNSWSVAVIGQLSRIVDCHDLERAYQLPLGPWPKTSSTFVKLEPKMYSGRRHLTRAANLDRQPVG